MTNDYETDDLHFYGNPQQIAGMENGGGEEEESLTPGSIFDEDDVMSQIFHALGMASDDTEVMGELPPEEPPIGETGLMPPMPMGMPQMGMPPQGMMGAPPLG